ncbi:TonB-dependent receptor domain-containing protein [Sandarakinorhabdus sp.]|uniref:TonB-dependent receptor domain-containing protein n=1 Tax=Sandarakinorhabdus sp. TaxID=1916663 RepID=UPI00286E3AEB|nr:TonB-dependent receptor [Sandarakinorhabdus sp.]
MRSMILAGASVLTLTTVAAMPAFAQAASAPVKAAAADKADEAEAEMVIVTGSRIARVNLETPVPVTTLTAAELTQQGAVSLGDRLSLLPQFRPTFSTQNAGRFIGTAGLSILDLRGQGTARTLVLQNGMRHVSSSPGTQQVDVNAIPVDLIERVDIVTGGNSAVYGSDAVAGVVNFVLKRDFEGITGRVQAGTSSRGDARNYLASMAAGTNFADGRGNIAIAAEFSRNDPLYFSDRDSFAGAFSGRSQFQLTEDTARSGTGNTPEIASGNGISDTTFTRGIKNIGISTGGAFTSTCQGVAPGDRATLNCGGVFNSAGTSQFGNVFAFLPDGTLVKNAVTRDFRTFGSGNGVGGIGSTLRETGLLQTGNTRYAFNLLSSFEVSEGFRPYIEAKWVRTESIQEGQPTFSSGALNPVLSINNAFLTTQARNLLTTSLAPGATGFQIQRFNIDFGGRGENHSRDLYRVVVGADGTFMDTWRYQVALNYGRVDTFYQTRGNVLLSRFTSAANAQRNAAGQIVCGINNDAIATNDDAACVPINLFGLGAPTQAALDYVLFNSTRNQSAEQYNAVAFISGDSEKLFSLPGGPVGFVVGGEWRQERSFSQFDATTRGGLTFLNSIATFAPPNLNVYDAFGEIRLPILKDVAGAKELSVEGSARVSKYSSGPTGTILAYNGSVVYAPVNDLKFRVGYGRAVRAPTQSDLFSAQSQTFLNGLVDPCGQQNINANPNRVANCAAAGVPTTQTFNGTTEAFTNRPASGISGLNGGNPNLTEERSTSWTAGLVFQPSFVPGLTLTVDWYRISLSNAINTIGAQTIINQCYDEPGGINNSFCAAITRNPNGTFAGQQNVLHGGNTVDFPTTGNGSSFLQGPFNYARQRTTGIDFDLSYRTSIGQDWRVSTRLIASYLIERNVFTSITEPNRLTQEKVTLGNPEWNAQWNLTVGYKDFDLAYNFRYFSKQTVAGNWRTQNVEQGRPAENLDAFPFPFYPAYTYSDVRFTAKLQSWVTAFVGVDNIFDKLPPFDLLGTGAGDAIFTNTGRYFYGGIQGKF